MPSRLQRRLEQQPPQSIDMSPLLDVVFILLIRLKTPQRQNTMC